MDVEADYCLIPPNSFVLAETVEYIEIPRDVLWSASAKHVRPVRDHRERHAAGAGVARQVTIEICNTTPLPAKIYAGEGIAQILFFRATPPCKTSYADKKGKYQDQPGLTLPIVTGEK